MKNRLCAFLLIFANWLFLLQCQGEVQVIYYTSIYNHSVANITNNYGDNTENSPSADSVSGQDGNMEQKPKDKAIISKFSPYFGVEFVPYVKSASFPVDDYTKQDLKEMLSVILTRSHSVLTMEMGYFDQDYTSDQWDTTVPSEIATVTAKMNNDQGTMLLTVSQGAGVLNKDGPQPDIEAAFYSAQHANSIYPKTVWGITLVPNYYDSSTEGYPQISKSCELVKAQLQKHYIRAHSLNLKLGAFIDQCDDIMGGSLKPVLVEMAHSADYFVCSMYPKQAVSDPQDYFNVVVNQYKAIKTAFQRYVPSLEVILQTGWATHGKSRNNPEYMNSPSKSERFWELMAVWSGENKIRVFMHEAFDIPRRSGNSSWGFWKWKEERYQQKSIGQEVFI